ncbi:MAG: (2Fe-2S)-binding protein [Betaproteobacteria bacterium]|nr:(2Fe-2S)-binding protein [Betaproteobacteria bacterium]
MGDFMRQYWIPAMKSSELVPNGAPMRLMLLGEKLIAFRDSGGRVGVMSQNCPHRNASLFLARNEADGLRCIYHGWKFDALGNCVDMPNVPAESDFRGRVKTRAYKTYENKGLIWVYMGGREKTPPRPMLEVMMFPENELQILLVQRNCNWSQSLEGDIDTSHAGFLHYGNVQYEDVPEGHYLEHMLIDRAPRYQVQDMPWGISSGAYRKVRTAREEERMYWRFCSYMFPFWSQTPGGEFPINVHARAWVPIDDGHTMSVVVRWRGLPKVLSAPLKKGALLPERLPDYRPNGTGWFDRWRLKADEGNDWQIDREAQSSDRIYSGMGNILLQDQAITEGMGPITDHAAEQLGAGDVTIVRMRRCVVEAAREFRNTGAPPPALDAPELYLGARGGYFLADPSQDVATAYQDQLRNALHPDEKEAA